MKLLFLKDVPNVAKSGEIKEVSDGNIEIKADETNQINLKAGKAKFTLMGIDKKDYPALPEFQKDKIISVKSSVIASMFRKTLFSVSKDSQKYVLNGVYFIIEDGFIKAVSTDGRRLSYVNMEGFNKDIKGKVIIPTKAVSDILRLISVNEKAEEIKISLSDNLMTTMIGDITFQTKLIEGVFPNYEQVIPKKTMSKIKLNAAQTMTAVKQMALLTGDKLVADRSSSIRLSFEKNKMLVSANTAGLGSGETEIDIEYDGEVFDMSFNPNYIKDILQNIEEENIYFSYTTPQSPIIITPEKDTSYLCVVMPMRA